MNSSLPTKRFVLTNQTSCSGSFSMMLLKLLLCGSNPSALLAATMACAKGCSEKFQFQYTAVLGWFRWENIRKRLGIHK
jgi:hypothetical protein